MSIRNPATGALASLLLSLAVYAILTAVLAWLYSRWLPGSPNVGFGYTPERLLRSFLLASSWFVPAICFWWLVVLLGARHRVIAGEEAPVHRLAAPADLWLLLAAIVYGLWVYAILTGRFPRQSYDCSGSGFLAICVGPARVWFWGGLAIAAGLLLIGLRQRLKAMGKAAATGPRPSQPPAPPGSAASP